MILVDIVTLLYSNFVIWFKKNIFFHGIIDMLMQTSYEKGILQK